MPERSVLGAEEQRCFDEEYPFIGSVLTQDRLVKDVMDHNYMAVMEAAQLAKSKFKATFVGSKAMGASDFGAIMIRPELMLRTTTDVGATHTTWEVNYTTVGWQAWIGTAAVNNRIDDDEVLLCQLGYLDYNPAPKVAAIQATINGAALPIDYIEYQMRKSQGMSLYELARPRIWMPGTRLFFQSKPDATGLDEMSIFGVAFLLGTMMVVQTPTLQSP